jgi:hypothetical protein
MLLVIMSSGIEQLDRKLEKLTEPSKNAKLNGANDY